MKRNTHRDPDGSEPRITLFLRSIAFAVGTMLASGIAAAASAGMADAQALYQKERTVCMSGKSHQDQATCLQEAGAAFEEAKRGKLSTGPGRYEQNQRLRCEAHQDAGDREDCLRRMRGEGTISGSVEGGGIYRELRTTVPAK